MKTILYIASILSLVSVFSCGSDNLITNSSNSTADSVSLFTKDSIYIHGFYDNSTDSLIYNCPNQVDTLHVSFSVHLYNVSGQAVYLLNSSTVFEKSGDVNGQYDSTYTAKIFINQTGSVSKFHIEGSPITGSNFYVSIKNIHLWYIKRT